MVQLGHLALPVLQSWWRGKEDRGVFKCPFHHTLLLLTLSHSVVSNSLWPYRLKPTKLLCPWDFPGKNAGVDCHFLLQGIFLIQGSNQCLLSLLIQFSSVAQSGLTLRPHELQHTRPPCPSPTARVYPNPCPLSQWCHPTISSSVVPFSSCPQSFPASGYFQRSQLFTSGGQSIGVSALTSVLARFFTTKSPGMPRVYLYIPFYCNALYYCHAHMLHGQFRMD